jgi:hypothetical protein
MPRPHAVALAALLLATPLLSGCLTCRGRADAWVGEPVADALEKFGPPDVTTPIGPNERYTWVRMAEVDDAFSSTGRTANPLKGGAMPRGELPSARAIEPGGASGYDERVAALLVSPNGTVLAWSGSCEAFETPSRGFFSW